MTMAKSDHKGLLDEFSAPTYEEWLVLVNEQLKGVPFEKKLVHQTADGIPVQPIYLKKDVVSLSDTETPPGQFPYIRGTRASGKISGSWSISQPFRYPDVETFNDVARQDLARGLTSLQLSLDKAGRAGMDPDSAEVGSVGCDGMSVINLSDIARALSGIDLGSISLQLDGGLGGVSLLLLLIAYCRSEKIDSQSLAGTLTFDPLSELATSGSLPVPLTVYYDQMVQLIRIREAHLTGFRTIGINAVPYCEGGGSASQELGYAMATAVEYFRELQQRNVAIDEIASSISFSFATGSDFFLEIAKLRAARSLWARIVAVLGGNETSQKAVLNSTSARYNKTVYDPYVNMLRTTTEAFSAVIGGTDVLSVTPFDDLFGLPNEMSRRSARNLQIVLQDECHGNRVIDPAGGSWFVENLTDQLGEAAWTVFQEVEKIGGMTAALKSGMVSKEIAAVDGRRKEKLGQRKDVAVGTNMYANLGETLPESRQPDFEVLWQRRSDEAGKMRSDNDVAEELSKLSDGSVAGGVTAAEKGATLGELNSAVIGEPSDGESAVAIVIQRKTEAYEALRQKSAALVKKTGQAPTVFLANMGPLRQHKARADFSVGFFQPGGFSVIYSDGFDDPVKAAGAAVASGALATVICSTDDTYPDLVPGFVRTVKEQKPEMAVIIAGYPKDHIARFQELGVDEFIHIKANNLQILTKLQAEAGA